jgi:hypothetical protein
VEVVSIIRGEKVNISSQKNKEEFKVNHIKLVGTKVENQYKGAGNALLVMEGDEPTTLIYENPECPPVSRELTEDDLIELFVSHRVDFEELEEKGAVILMGICSCYDFAFPEVFIDFKTN